MVTPRLAAACATLLVSAATASSAAARHVPPEEAGWAIVSARWNAAWSWHPTAPFGCASAEEGGNYAGTAEVHGYTGTMWARGPRQRLEDGFFTRRHTETSSYKDLDDEGRCVVLGARCDETGALDEPPTYRNHPRVRATKAGARVTIDRETFTEAGQCSSSHLELLGSVAYARPNPKVTLPWSKLRGRRSARVRYAATDAFAYGDTAGTVRWDVELLYGRGPGFRPDFLTPRRIWPRPGLRHSP